MKLDSKKILTIGAGAVVGYLLFCKFMKSGTEKSLEGGAIEGEASAEEPSSEQGGGGGGFGGGGGSISPLPPVIEPIVNAIPAGYVYLGNNTIAPFSAVQVGNPNTLGGVVTTQPTRETPPTPPPPPAPNTDVSGAPVVAIASGTKTGKTQFLGLDGNMNQDSIL
jgi:hypothetical protein